MNFIGNVGFIFIATCALAASSHAASSSQTISVLGIELKIGMEKEKILKNIKGFRIQCLGEGTAPECDSWIVQNNDGPPFTTYANIGFENGRVNTVLKYWERGFEGSNPTEFVQTLYDLFLRYTNQTPTNFTISTAEQREPGVTRKQIFLSSGRKIITISYTEGAMIGGKRSSPFVNL